MNKIHNLNYKLSPLNFSVNKILIKISLNISNKSTYPLSLILVREEIQKIILICVLIQFRIIFSSLSKTSLKKINNKLLIDMFLKILLLSSKQTVASKLSILKNNKAIKLNPSHSWLLKDIEFQEYSLINFILNSAKPSAKKKSVILVESLIENFVIKLGDIVSYELFYEPKFSTVFFNEYATDFWVFKKDIQKLQFYIYIKKIFERKYILFKKIYSTNYPILICTKKGMLLKTLNSTNLF
jgi:hypothetical protein